MICIMHGSQPPIPGNLYSDCEHASGMAALNLHFKGRRRMDQENKSPNVNIAFIDKGKPAERQGRKAEGLRCVSMMTVWLPRGLRM